MKKTITKSTMLVASIAALAAFAMPSMASAANWGPVNTNHTLTGSINFYVPSLATGFGCAASLGVHARVPASSTLDVTSATFSSCSVLTGIGKDCKVTAAATGLPWTATGTSTSDVRINVTDITLTYAADPGKPGACSWVGFVAHVSGTLTGGAWSAAAHSVTYSNDTGLTYTYGFGAFYNALTNSVLTESGAFPSLTLT